jgi:hypothetical protein
MILKEAAMGRIPSRYGIIVWHNFSAGGLTQQATTSLDSYSSFPLGKYFLRFSSARKSLGFQQRS